MPATTMRESKPRSNAKYWPMVGSSTQPLKSLSMPRCTVAKHNRSSIVKFGVSGPGSEETVTVTPEVASVLITVNGRFAWVAETGIILGTLVLEKGQTAQDEINRMEKPDVKFFDWVEIPDRILDPVKLQNGLGSTLVTTRGLIPSSEEQSIDPRDPKALIRILRERSPWTKGLCNRYMAVREARATSRRSLWGGDACEEEELIVPDRWEG